MAIWYKTEKDKEDFHNFPDCNCASHDYRIELHKSGFSTVTSGSNDLKALQGFIFLSNFLQNRVAICGYLCYNKEEPLWFSIPPREEAF